MLYKAIHNPQRDDLIQFLGVYGTQWGIEKEPTIAFIEVEYDVEGLCDKLSAALEDAANRLEFLTNWIESSYGGSNRDVELGRSYTREANDIIAVTKTERTST